MTKTVRTAILFTASLAIASVVMIPAEMAAQSAAAPHQSGTVKAVAGDSLTVTNATGQDYMVKVPAGASILNVPPGAKSLSAATPGQISDVAVGDKVIVTGTDGDTGMTLTARRVVLMKSAAIADMHATEEAAWAKGGGGIVKSVDVAGGKITVSSGLKPLVVTTTPATDVRRYANGSVKAADAVKSSIAEIHPGEHLRVRGTKSEDGSTITADAILAGDFKDYSGLITAIDPAAGTITLKDLTTKKSVTVVVGANSDMRAIPEMMARMVAARMKGGAAAGPGAGRPGGAAGAGPGAGTPGGGAPGGGAAGGGGFGGGDGRPRNMDLGQMLQRLPTQTLAELKSGEAIMIVAMPPPTGSGPATAVTLLSGVEPLLEAAPNGQGVSLSAWSLGGGDAGAASGAMPQ